MSNIKTIKIFTEELNNIINIDIDHNNICKYHYSNNTYGNLLYETDNSIVIIWNKLNKTYTREYIKTDNNDYYVHNAKSLIPESWNPKSYRELNKDLLDLNMDDRSLMQHYIEYGIEENRIFQLSKLPENFDYRLYRLLNPDLRILSTQHEIENHYIAHGQKEQRRYTYGFTYDQMISIKDNQTHHLLLKPTIILINHDSSLTGAPLALVDIANFLDDNNFKNILFIDILPNNLFKLNKRIKKLYHFNDDNVLLDIIDNTTPILIYSNSLTLMVQNPKKFEHLLYKTVFHLHECFSDLISFIGDNNKFKYLVDHSKNICMVAPKIVEDSNLLNIDKVKIITPFISKDKTKTILKYQKKKKQLSDKVTICMCGSVSIRKNPELFIHLAKMNPNYHFVWVGADLGVDLPNIQCIEQTNNPYETFSQIDYFFLTSIREPFGTVIIENLFLNNKIILLEDNIKYNYDISKLENVFVIRNHNNNYNIINTEFQKLNINKKPNKSIKNIQYIKNNFLQYNVVDTTAIKHKSHIILSFYNKPNQDLNYYTNIINQKLLFDKTINSITISIADDDGATSKYFLNNINHNNIIINKRNNAGWDIGGLVHSLCENRIYKDEDYIMYIHNKSNFLWRQGLFKILYYNDYFKYDSVVAKEWYVPCEKDKILRELFKIHSFMNEVYDKSFNYISGTCFITRYSLLKNLISNSQYILNNLTDIDKDDTYWQKQMSNIVLFEQKFKNHQDHPIYNTVDEDARDVFLSTKSKNYFELLIKHNKKGIPDYTFEHALERYIGYLISQNRKVHII